jgi:WD40 repeat protein
MHSDFRLQGVVVSLICQPVHRLCVAAALLGTSVLLSTQDVSAVTALKKAPANYQFVPLQTFTVSGSVAEIAAVTPNGKTVLYTDSEEKEVGFVDISNPAVPQQLGAVTTAGEPTSVAITPGGRYALVCTRGPDLLLVIDLRARRSGPTIVADFPLGGQPDSVVISPDGRYAAIAIENERLDEDLPLPSDPPGFLTIVDLKTNLSKWSLRDVSMTGIAERFSDDPEPEFISINKDNVAAVTLQENNHVVLVSLRTGQVLMDWSAGTTTHAADLLDDGVISFTDTLTNARLEPDAIAWTPDGNLITANEGDYDLDLASGQFTGGRNFTIFSPDGALLYDSGAQLEMAIAAAGRYNDSRSDSRGVEPEGVAVAKYKGINYAFIGTERGDSVGVYRLDDETQPTFVQLLLTSSRPEGLLPIPQRNLFITANEGDGTLSIFSLEKVN